MKKRTKLIIGAGLAAGVLYASKTENRQFVIRLINGLTMIILSTSESRKMFEMQIWWMKVQ